MTTILCTSVRKNNREPLTGDRRRGPRPLPSLRKPPSLPVPEHRDTALSPCQRSEKPIREPRAPPFTGVFFSPSSIFAQERAPSAFAGQQGPVPLGGLRAGRRHVGGRSGGAACPKMAAASQVPRGAGWGRGGQLPSGKGVEKRAQILVVITFTIFKNSYYFTIFHASPEPVNLREMGGRFRCWLSVVKKRWG